jgi:hypothetical protein
MPDTVVCSICKMNDLISEDSRQRGYCAECQQAFGLWARAAPSPRPIRPCARCGHPYLVRCLVRERGCTGGQRASRMLGPFAATFHRVIKMRFLSNLPRPRSEPDFDRPVGMFEAHVCRSCGFVDWYVSSPSDIPIGPEFGTEIIDALRTVQVRRRLQAPRTKPGRRAAGRRW